MVHITFTKFSVAALLKIRRKIQYLSTRTYYDDKRFLVCPPPTDRHQGVYIYLLNCQLPVVHVHRPL